MTQEEIYQAVRETLIGKFEIPAQEINPEADLFNELDLDSIDALDWFTSMEKEMGLPVIAEEIREIRKVQDVVDYIMRHLKK